MPLTCSDAAAGLAATDVHILLTVNSSWNAVHFRRPLIEALVADNHRVTVLAPRDAQSPALAELGCRFVPLDMDPKGLSPLRNLAMIFAFLRHFRRERPDAVLSYTVKNNVFGGLAARALKIPFLPTVTGLGTAFLSARALETAVRLVYKAAFRRVPAVFFQNRDDRALFLEKRIVTAEQAHLVPGSGLDLAYFSPAPLPAKSVRTFLLIARLLRDKGVFEFVEAARRVRQRNPEVRFQLLGPLDAENRTAIDPACVEAWEREGVIAYLGTADDVRPAIAAADCVVLPSYREGMPRSLLEAAAMGRPVIATDVPGCRDAVDAGVTGFLCAARDAGSLCNAMLEFLALPAEAAERMGRAGRAKVEAEYDQKLVIDAYRRALAGVAAL